MKFKPNRSIKMHPKEWMRIEHVAKKNGETINGFVRRVSHLAALKWFVSRNVEVLENFIGDAFDNKILSTKKQDES